MHDTNKKTKTQSAFAEVVYYYIYGYVMMICIQTAITYCISYITVKIRQNAKKSAYLVLNIYIESNHRIYILNQIINIHYMQKAQNKKIKGILLKAFKYVQA